MKTAKTFFPALLAASLLFTGCQNSAQESSSSSAASESSQSAEQSSKPQETQSSSSESEPEREPVPTIFTGLDGKVVNAWEITSAEADGKAPEKITDEDVGAAVVCEGFTYVRDPLGFYYDSYHDPDKFGEYLFEGEVPENNNPWKRLRVGDEVCGLKVKSAVTRFEVNGVEEYGFDGKYIDYLGCFAELDGTYTCEGFLQVTARSAQYVDSGEMIIFYPAKAALPLTPPSGIDEEKGFVNRIESATVYSTDIKYISEILSVNLGYYNDAPCHMDGLDVGDVAYARVTLTDIKLICGSIEASLDEVELISDIIVHVDDSSDVGAGIGRD